MKTIYLHGHLKEQFGDSFRLSVRSAAEAVRALEANFPGKFFMSIRDGVYKVQRGPKQPLITEDQLQLELTSDEIHIVPVIKGSGGGKKGKGIVGIVLGVALIAAAVAFAPAAAAGSGFMGANLGASVVGGGGLFGSVTFGNVALWGVGLAISGISSFISPTPKLSQAAYSNRETPDERPSFIFTGAVNNTEQGGPIPLVYGRHRVGTVVISGGLNVERLPV